MPSYRTLLGRARTCAIVWYVLLGVSATLLAVLCAMALFDAVCT